MNVRTLIHSLALGTALVWAPSAARAHFVLMQPPSFQNQNGLGDPQKAGPCGGTGVKTGMVTKYKAGDMVHFVFQETIAHGGHYRIALGLTGPADLPADPPVMAQGGLSISVPIQKPPVFPVLADEVNPHQGNIATPKMWTYDVKLPANMTCDQCVLQITQFMTDHGSNTGGNDGFFYHHCASIQIAAAAAPDGGTPVADAGGSPDTSGAVDVRPPSDTPAGGGTGGSGGSGGSVGTGGAGGGGTGGGGAGGSSGTGGSSGAGGSSGTGGSSGAGGSSPPAKGSSGGCTVAGAASASPWIVLAAAGLLLRRRRRRA